MRAIMSFTVRNKAKRDLPGKALRWTLKPAPVSYCARPCSKAQAFSKKQELPVFHSEFAQVGAIGILFVPLCLCTEVIAVDPALLEGHFFGASDLLALAFLDRTYEVTCIE